jgi:hypothetical protein
MAIGGYGDSGAGNRRRAPHSSPDAVGERSGAARTNLQDLLKTGIQVMPRRSLVFVVSDFISVPGWEQPLALMARRHEVMAVRLYDPLEMELPDLGLLVVQDAETGEQLFVDTHDQGFRTRFAAAAVHRETRLRSAFSRAGVSVGCAAHVSLAAAYTASKGSCDLPLRAAT